jgi:hypothetical protein
MNSIKNSKYLLIILLIFLFAILFAIEKIKNRYTNKKGDSFTNFSNTNVKIYDHFLNYKTYVNNYSNVENDNNYTNYNNNISYYRCSEKLLGKITNDIFNNNNIQQSNDNWNLYIPCGYNDVEEELKQILIKDSDGKINTKYIFGLNGCDSIVSKNEIWNSLIKCYGRKYASTLMPESYILDDKNEMEIFRKNFNPSKNDIYIMKKNVQRKEGLKLTRDYFEIIGGADDEYRIVQKYISDLYLINQRKVNLRIYLLIVIKDYTVYFYLCKNGKCIYTNKKYNDNDLDFETNITSYNLDMSVYKTNPRNFDELKTYINNDNKNNDSGENLFNNIEVLMKEISACLSRNFYQSKNIEGSITFQLFGADVIIDKNLRPYLLEINKGPDMSPRDETDEMMKTGVQIDMFKTVGILKDSNGGLGDISNSFYLIYKNSIKR